METYQNLETIKSITNTITNILNRKRGRFFDLEIQEKARNDYGGDPKWITQITLTIEEPLTEEITQHIFKTKKPRSTNGGDNQ